MRKSWKRWAGIVGLALLVGCGPEAVWVTRRPAFNYEKVHRIGVITFAVTAKGSEAEGAGAVLADKIARFLIEHQDYQVVPPEQVAKALEATKYSPPLPLDAEAVKRIGQVAGVDSLVTGTVTTCSFKQTEATKLQPEYTDTGYAVYRDGAIPYRSVRNEAEIVAEMRVYDTATGALVWSDSFGYTSWAQGAPPPRNREQVLEDASDQVAAKLFLGLVVSKNRVQIPADSIFTSAGFVGQQYVNRTTTFTPRNEKVFVVLALGTGFGGNRVTVKVFKKGEKLPVAAADRVWDDKVPVIGVPFLVKGLTSQAGFGKYEAKYFINDREIRGTGFALRPTA